MTGIWEVKNETRNGTDDSIYRAQDMWSDLLGLDLGIVTTMDLSGHQIGNYRHFIIDSLYW